jgi:predicted flap endonuclease-1-like 5' DNA nuclease
MEAQPQNQPQQAEQIRQLQETVTRLAEMLAQLDSKTDSNAKAIEGIGSAVESMVRSGVKVRL